MKTILGEAKTVRETLKDVKYSIDYYQREYKWEEKQAQELIDDLANKFLEEHDPSNSREKVAEYAHYFLGAIIISEAVNTNYIVDGQQRLTSLTLLLIILRNLQNAVNVEDLIASEKYGVKSFNLDVPEREPCMEALLEGKPFDPTDHSESVQNLYARYQNMQSALPEELDAEALPYFVDWLLDNVHFVKITTSSNDDAYTIFETMNDRGLSLSPTDMLKGYLLANIDESKRTEVNAHWRKRSAELNDVGKEIESDCFKAWLRSQYASKIRKRKRGAKPEEFDRIGTEFHRWLRDSKDKIGLTSQDEFFNFINHDFDFYTQQYLQLVKASKGEIPELKHIYYNAQLGFTLQNMILLAPLCPDDEKETIYLKLRLTARFIDILLAWRLWNSRQITYPTMHYAMFLIMCDIRRLEPQSLAEKLRESLDKEKETFDSNDRLRVHQQNRRHIHRFLARLTDFVETSSGQASRYTEYVSEEKQSRYEVEHIWANDFERHADEFEQAHIFNEHRNQIGGLLLLPKSHNASYGNLPYEEKLSHYRSQNLLAHSLHLECYKHNPRFQRFIKESGLQFKPYTVFKKADIDERTQLYRQIAKHIWNPDDLLNEVSS